MSGLVQLRSRAGGRSAATQPGSGDDRTAPTVYLETFGCQMNEADSALILGQLRRGGYRQVDDPAAADLILVNTCAVREKAEERVYGRTSQLLEHRRARPGLVIGITGCMAEHLRERLATTAPQVSLVVGPDGYRHIAALADEALRGHRVVEVELDREETYEGLDGDARDDGVSAFVTVQRGCDKFCSFCVVPFTRGRERAVAPREVLRSVRALAARGYREVTLLGQTVNSYRYEDVGFAELLRAVARVDGIERIRFTSPYPIDFTPELIACIAEEDKLCPYVHLPVQSGADAVLSRMKRGHTRAEYVDLVGRLRAAVPDLAISTDLMVGFCGESDDDHEQTLSLMRELEFDSAFMFAYSDRELTFAAKNLADDVAEELKNSRLREVIALQELHTRASHARRVGRQEAVLVSGPSRRGDCLVGRTGRYENVLLPLGSAEAGTIVRVEILRSTGHSLSAIPDDDGTVRQVPQPT